MFVDIEYFFQVRKVSRFTVICISDFGLPFRVVVPPVLRKIVHVGCFIGVDSVFNIRCVLDSSRRIIFLDRVCKITYKKNPITPLTSRIIF